MGFPGIWMTTSESVAYRVIPKCACSSIGQIMYYSDHGKFYDGDIHDAKEGLHKWAFEPSRGKIIENMRGHKTYTFTCVRNPYSRILSSFFDKICGIQRNGNRYRKNMIPKLAQHYGIEVEGDFDQIKSFRRFALFARDTILWHRPMDPDIHWSPMRNHAHTLINEGGRYSHIFPLENFKAGMSEVLSNISTPHPVDMEKIPRFNESEGHGPKRAHPIEDYFDDLTMHLIHQIYKRDFELFGYDMADPARKAPVRAIDVDAVNAALAG